jgi:hypothetical protein
VLGVDVASGFVDAMVASPLGVTLLAVLESRERRPAGWRLSFEPTPMPMPTPASVAAAVVSVESMSFGELVEVAVISGDRAGPWNPRAPSTVATAYLGAQARRPIAEAVAGRFGAALHQPVDRAAQQWWSEAKAPSGLDRLTPLFRDFEHVYGAGQFTWAGLWTVTDPPVETHQQLIGAWELEQGPVSRWRLPVRAEARVFEVHRPSDWARLVMEHPREGMPHPDWELPGINQRPGDLHALMTVPGQRAARTTLRRHVVPDWRMVAERYDGVHLSWAGFITAEGCVTDLGDGDCALLRYWFSERTHWLADVFGEPEAAADPRQLDEPSNAPVTDSDMRSRADQRRVVERSLLRLLGR